MQNIEINTNETDMNKVNTNETDINKINTDETDINHIIEQQQPVELPDESANDPIKESLTTIFKHNYDNYIHKDLSDPTIDTTTNKNIKKSLLDAANDV